MRWRLADHLLRHTCNIRETMSDNPSRTAKTFRRILKDKGFVTTSLTFQRSSSDVDVLQTRYKGFTAPVACAFKKTGKIILRPRDDATYEQVWDDVMEAGPEDLSGEIQPHDPAQTELELCLAASKERTTNCSPLCLQSGDRGCGSPEASLHRPVVSCDHVILESGFEYIPANPDAPGSTVSEEDEDRLETLYREMPMLKPYGLCGVVTADVVMFWVFLRSRFLCRYGTGLSISRFWRGAEIVPGSQRVSTRRSTLRKGAESCQIPTAI